MPNKKDKPILHKNIRGAEYYAQAIKEATEGDKEVTTPILRLREFVAWAKSEGLCKSEHDFERQCKLSPKYLANNSSNGRGNIGTKMLGLIVREYPMLNLAWLCTGEGAMVCKNTELNTDYKEAYEAAMKHIEALNRMIGEK